MALPGSAVVPAVESRRRDLAERTGVRAVELARNGIRPDDVMTPDAFDNAIRVLSATGGSTNEFIHLVAIAGRLGITLGLDRFADIGEQTPQVLGVRPSGPYALEDFDHAGGVPALLAVLEPLLDPDCVLADGRTVAEVAAGVNAAKPRPNPCLRSLDDPFLPNSGLVVLRGSLAPKGAIFKRSAAARKFWTHRGPAVVFDYHTAHEQAKNPDLHATPDSVIVLRNAGIVGAPGMPEIDFVPIPANLRDAGITGMVCVTDGRMSGTEGGPTALHVTPKRWSAVPSDWCVTATRLCSTPSPADSICWLTTKSLLVGPTKPHRLPRHPTVAMSVSTPSMCCKPTRAATWTSWSITADTKPQRRYRNESGSGIVVRYLWHPGGLAHGPDHPAGAVGPCAQYRRRLARPGHGLAARPRRGTGQSAYGPSRMGQPRSAAGRNPAPVGPPIRAAHTQRRHPR